MKTPTILLETKEYIIINKPAGLIVHADGKTKEPTVVDWVCEHFPGVKEVGEPLKLSTGVTINRPGIVHRLDRDTSGVMIVAKTQTMFEFLKEKFQTRDMHKTYHAFTYGQIKEDEGTIDRPISRAKNDFRLWSAQRGGRGEAREAVTDFKVLARGAAIETDFPTDIGGKEVASAKKSLKKEADSKENKVYEPYSFVEVMPQTGRTHQIRVHMKAINHPLVADHLYAPKRKPLFGFKRVALHAYKLEFSDPKGKKVKAVAPYPDDFSHALAEIKFS